MTRVLFVSEATVGGSPRSQRELAIQLERRGHEVLFLVSQRPETPRVRRLYEHVSDASVRLSGGLAGPLAAWLRDRIGRQSTASTVDGLQHLSAAIVTNALPETLQRFHPDVVVVSSVERWAWRQIESICRLRYTAVILYLREDDSLDHLATSNFPDVLVANANSLASAMSAKGHDCAVLPSVVDTSVTAVEPTRTKVLAINAVPSRGGATFWAVAQRLPEIPFVMQESWPLTGDLEAEVLERAKHLPNVEVRRQRPPGPHLYRDARLLMVPYRVDNRPRVILEAQANGIPAVVGDVPALVEAIGAGGVSVASDSVDEWVETIRNLWHSQGDYERLVEEAYAQSRRPEVDPHYLTDQFEKLVTLAVERSMERSGH